MEATEPEGTEENVEDAVVDLLEADVVTGQEMTDRDTTSVPADTAVLADLAKLEVSRIGDRPRPRRVAPLRRTVEIGRRPLIERFVRTHGVELEQEGIEATLLAAQGGGDA